MIQKIWTQKRIDKELAHFTKLPYSLQFQMTSCFLKQNKQNWSYFKTLLENWMEKEELEREEIK